MLRLEKSFGADIEKLLSLQTEYIQYEMSENEKEIAVRTYSPGFFDIAAGQIEAWSQKLEARALLPVLIRRLVNTTGKDLSKVDFPAYENIQRHGWDGHVESGSVALFYYLTRERGRRESAETELSIIRTELEDVKEQMVYGNRTASQQGAFLRRDKYKQEEAGRVVSSSSGCSG